MTQKVVLRTVEEFMSSYKPVYGALYPMLLGNSQIYSQDVGKINFNAMDAMGDLRMKRITPKDTELATVSARESAKTFKKYFFANQFTQSALQDTQGNERVIAQVLEENQKLADELLLLGDGTSAGTVVNNGLYWSGDSNYVLNPISAPTVSTGTALYTELMKTVATADAISGQKQIIFYGESTLAMYDSIYPDSSTPFKGVFKAGLESGYNTPIKMPAAVTPASAEGWIIINMDQVKLHMTCLPKLAAQGVNDEKMYSWHNFLCGSMMLEVLASGGVIRQDAVVS